MSALSDDEISDLFITQSKFTPVQFGENDINSDFEELLDKRDTTVENNSSDEDLLHCTQEIKKNNNVDKKDIRFAKPLSKEELKDFEEISNNKNTEKKSQWAVKVFQDWYLERRKVHLQNDFLKFSNQDLNRLLTVFITEVRSQKGDEYHGNTIHEMLTSIQYFMRQNGRNINFLSDFEFLGLRKMLDAKMRYLAKSGIGFQKKKADVTTCAQEDVLWEKGMLGEDSPQQLLHTVFYLNGICFCLRGGEEHHALRTGGNSQFDIVLKDGVKNLRYSEGVTKTNNGGLRHKNLKPKSITVGPNTENTSRCPVRLYEKYMSLRPNSCQSFYLRPLKYPKPDVWYYNMAVGRHTLSTVVKRLCESAGMQGNFTNHSLRATTATRLFNSGVDEQLIAERTGHRSTAIREYKRTSEHLETLVDNVVQRKTPKLERHPDSPQENKPADTLSITVEKDGTKLTLKM